MLYHCRQPALRLPPFSLQSFFAAAFLDLAMAAPNDGSAPPTTAPAPSLPAAPDAGPAAAEGGEEAYDVVETYKRLLAEDPDMTKPIAALVALIGVLRRTTSSTAMETYEITGAQVKRLHAAMPNSLPLEAGTALFTKYLSMSTRQPAKPAIVPTRPRAATAASASAKRPAPAAAAAAAADAGDYAQPDSFDSIRQHLIDNSELFVQRAKEARAEIAKHASALIHQDDCVLVTGASRAVTATLIKAAERLRGSSSSAGPVAPRPPADATVPPATAPPFTVLHVWDERARAASAAAAARLRGHGLAVYELDPSAAAYAMAAHRVQAIFLGSEAVTHDGKLVSRMGTMQLAQLAQLARPQPGVYALAETHKFVHKLLLGNTDLGRIGIRNGFTPKTLVSPTQGGVPTATKPPLAFDDQIDVTMPNFITSIVTENGIMQPSSSYFVLMY